MGCSEQEIVMIKFLLLNNHIWLEIVAIVVEIDFKGTKMEREHLIKGFLWKYVGEQETTHIRVLMVKVTRSRFIDTYC